MDYLPIIHGRRCVPVRLLPHLTNWSPLSPDVVASLFAHEYAFFKWDLQSFLLKASGQYVALPPAWWEDCALDLDELQRELQGQPQHVWRRRSIETIPAGVFVWLDDLQATIGPVAAKTPGDWHRGVSDEEEMPDDWPQGLSDADAMFDDWRHKLSEKEERTPGIWRGKRSEGAKLPDQWRRELTFTPMWSDEEERIALEGFGAVAISAPVAAMLEPVCTRQAAGLTPVMVANSPAPTHDAQAQPAPVVHKVKRRTDRLDSVIRKAREQAANPSSWMSVWDALVVLAQKAGRPPPLLGYDEDGGVKYQADTAEAVAWLNREAFRKRAARKDGHERTITDASGR